jgi:hypothetical protein
VEILVVAELLTIGNIMIYLNLIMMTANLLAGLYHLSVGAYGLFIVNVIVVATLGCFSFSILKQEYEEYKK